MGRRCAISSCVNYSPHPQQTIHIFPQKNPFLRKRWVEFTKLASDLDVESNNLDNFGICGLHFLSDSFHPDDRDESKDGKGQLKSNAVPVKLSNNLNIEELKTPGYLMISHDHTYAKVVDTDQLLKLEIEGLKRIIEQKDELLAQKSSTIASLRSKVGKLEKKIGHVVETFQRFKNSCEKNHSDTMPISGNLDKIFSPGQIRLLKNPKLAFVHWNEEDKSKAIALHSVSSRAYQYLRETIHFPLPSQSTIHTWLRGIEMRPGKCIPVIMKVIAAQLQNETPMNRMCALAIDEMNIDPRFCYYPEEDRVLGKAKNVTVITIRGIFASWKQVLFYTFESAISTAQLVGILRELHSINADVIALTSDMGTKNQGMWKQLKVGQVKNGVLGDVCFKHPSNEQRNVYVFPDLPHLIKLLRNHTLDNAIHIGDGVIVDKRMFKEFIEIQKGEFKLTQNITQKNVNLRGRKRQAVKPTFQLFSHRVAEGLKFLFPQNTIKQRQADFLQLVNDFCDISNTRTSSEVSSNPFKCAYGMYQTEQDELFDKAYDMFSSMRVGSRKNSYAPFQRGLLMFIKSMKGLLYAMQQPPVNAKYIMTARVNQDLLENAFSRLRGFGHFSMTPNAVEVIYRIKKLLVSWNYLDSGRTSVEFEESVPDQAKDLIKLVDTTRDKPIEPFSNEILTSFDRIDTTVSPQLLDRNYYGLQSCCEEGGIEYVAGYIAKKLMFDHPELSKRGSNEIRDPFWVGRLSENLVEPSSYWCSVFNKFEEYFSAVHPVRDVNYTPGVCSNLINSISCRFPHIDMDIIRLYVRTRTHIRIKYLNKKIEDENYRFPITVESSQNDWEGGECSTNDPEICENLSEEGEAIFEFLDELVALHGRRR